MNVLKANSGSGKWVNIFKLVAVCLVGAAVLGTSAFSLKLATENTPDFKRFAGTWVCKYKGRAFFTLRMEVRDGALGGTAVHSTRIVYVDGEFIPDSDENTTDKIVEAHVAGKKLMLKVADGNDSSESIPLELTLTGENQAEGKIIAENQSEVPAQKKPWQFRRVSNP